MWLRCNFQIERTLPPGLILFPTSPRLGSHSPVFYNPRELMALKIHRRLQPADIAGPRSDVQGPSFAEALRDQLGLRLEPSNGEVQVLLIGHIERPSN